MARIAIIEDDPQSARLFRVLVESRGHAALIATDGQAGVALVRSELPALVVCDVNLPILDGIGVIAALRADPMTAHIPIIAVTAFAMVGDRERLLAAGFDGYISKPITPLEFVDEIELFLPESGRTVAARRGGPGSNAATAPEDSPF